MRVPAKLAFFCAALCLTAASAFSDEIRLKDGKKLYGVIVAYEDNMFRIKTDFGFVLVEKDKIASIIPTTPGSATPASTPSANGAKSAKAPEKKQVPAPTATSAANSTANAAESSEPPPAKAKMKRPLAAVVSCYAAGLLLAEVFQPPPAALLVVSFLVFTLILTTALVAAEIRKFCKSKLSYESLQSTIDIPKSDLFAIMKDFGIKDYMSFAFGAKYYGLTVACDIAEFKPITKFNVVTKLRDGCTARLSGTATVKNGSKTWAIVDDYHYAYVVENRKGAAKPEGCL